MDRQDFPTPFARVGALPTPEAYRDICSALQKERPLCGFYFILDGFPKTAHKPSYGFAGGRVPMLWMDFRTENVSQLVEWSAVEALSAGDIFGDRSRRRAELRGSGHVWVGDRDDVRSLIIGEEFITSRDGEARGQRPCGWLPNLAWQCKENEHIAMPVRASLLRHPSFSEDLGRGHWPVEYLEPRPRSRVIRTPEGKPDQLIVGLVIRDEFKGQLTSRQGSEFCLPLLATSDDPQAWGHLEFFIELYASFYERQVAPFIGKPVRGYPPIDHVFRTFEDLSRIQSAADLPRGENDGGRRPFAEGEIQANIECFVDEACAS